jgi:hypothetical protein
MSLSVVFLMVKERKRYMPWGLLRVFSGVEGGES